MKEKDVRFKCSNCGYTRVITKQILNIDGSYQIECDCMINMVFDKQEINSLLYNYCEKVHPTKDGKNMQVGIAHIPYVKLNLTNGTIDHFVIRLFDDNMFYSISLDFTANNLREICQVATTRTYLNKIKITDSILSIENKIENIQTIYDHMITFIKNMNKARLYL